MEFKDLLKKTRQDNKVSIEELSQKVAVSEETLLRFEDGSSLPFIEDLVKICNALNVTPNDLLLGVTFQRTFKESHSSYRHVPLYSMKKLNKEEKIKYIQSLQSKGESVYNALLQRKLRINYGEAKELLEIAKSM